MTARIPKVTRSTTLVAGLFTLLTSVQAHAQVFTAVASACVIDSESDSKYETTAGRLRLSGNNTGEIVARCNVTNPMDSGGNPGFYIFEAVVRDPDGRLADSRVQAKLWRVSNANGGVAQLGVTLDSNVHGSFAVNANSQLISIDVPGVFDFYRYAYFIEIRVKRTSTNQVPDISLVRLKWVLG